MVTKKKIVLQKLVNDITDLVFPRRCPVCGDVVKKCEASGYICPECRMALRYIETPVCLKCGKHIESEEQEYCEDCSKKPKHFEKGYPVFMYEGALRGSIMAFKYKNKREYAAFYAEEIMRRHGHVLRSLDIDGLVPVPVHPSRRRRRGYNQAEVLAKELSKRLELPCYSQELYRVEKTSAQKNLNEKERQRNLKNAFKRKRNGVELKKVLLVDDIYTSGATVEACTRVLLGTGVEQVYYTSICIGQGR